MIKRYFCSEITAKLENDDEICKVKITMKLKIGNSMIIESKLFHADFFLLLDGVPCKVENNRHDNLIMKDENVYESLYHVKNWDTSEKCCMKLDCTLIINMMRKVANLEVKTLDLEDHWIKTFSFKGIQDVYDFKDFTFIVDKQHFNVHKIVLASSSVVLKTMFTTKLGDASLNSTKIDDTHPKVFQTFLHFIYGNKEEFYNIFDEWYALDIYQIAHKYQVEALKQFCVGIIFDNHKHHTSDTNIMETYMFACLYDLEDLKIFCWDIILL